VGAGWHRRRSRRCDHPQGAGRCSSCGVCSTAAQDSEAHAGPLSPRPRPGPRWRPYLHPRGTAACGSPPAVTFFVRRGGHTTCTCRTCDQTVYRPPLKTPCTCISVSSCRPDKFRRARCAGCGGWG